METVRLNCGHPDDALLPYEEVRQAMVELSGREKQDMVMEFLQYSCGDMGQDMAREQLALFLGENYGIQHTPSNFVLTSGISHGVDIVCHALTKPGDVVFVENPSYFLAFDIFEQRHLKVVGVDLRHASQEELGRQFAKHKPTLFYVIPSSQNPTGVSMSTEQKQRLARLCDAFGTHVVADEVYHLLRFSPDCCRRPMSSFSSNCISVSGFTKILSPGLRSGWIYTESRHVLDTIATNAVIISGGSPSQFSYAIIVQLLRNGGLEKYLNTILSKYESRCNALSKAIASEFGDEVSFTKPDGGFFLWLELPSKVDTTRFRAYCKKTKQGVDFMDSASCCPRESSRITHAVRLCFAFYPESVLVDGVQRLKKAYTSFMKQ